MEPYVGLQSVIAALTDHTHSLEAEPPHLYGSLGFIFTNPSRTGNPLNVLYDEQLRPR